MKINNTTLPEQFQNQNLVRRNRGKLDIPSTIGRGLGSHYPVQPCHIIVPVPSHGLDFQRHMSWSFLCSVKIFLLILVELMTITFFS